MPTNLVIPGVNDWPQHFLFSVSPTLNGCLNFVFRLSEINWVIWCEMFATRSGKDGINEKNCKQFHKQNSKGAAVGGGWWKEGLWADGEVRQMQIIKCPSARAVEPDWKGGQATEFNIKHINFDGKWLRAQMVGWGISGGGLWLAREPGGDSPFWTHSSNTCLMMMRALEVAGS